MPEVVFHWPIGVERDRYIMKIWVSLAVCLTLMSCDDANRDVVTFNCEASQEELPGLGKRVLFHYEGGFLFVQSDTGRAENVCSQIGTIDCDVKMSRNSLTLHQEVETPNCGWRDSVKSTFEIDRNSGALEFTQETCEPASKLVLTGTCEISADK